MSIYGIGINDANYPVYSYVRVADKSGNIVKKQVSSCPFYVRWHCMMTRCYSNSHLNKYPTYKGCSVVREWLTFSNFKKWMEKQDWEGNHLDKDLLIDGNKVYGPDTCMFISPNLNYFLLKGKENGLPTGVSIHKASGKYRAQCSDPISGKRIDLGLYSNPEDAHNSWLLRKREHAIELASLEEDERVKNALINRY